MSRSKLGIWFLFLFSLSQISCSRNSGYFGDPKGRLTEYISKSFSVRKVSDKGSLLAFLSGDVKTRLESWSDDQFREAFIDSKREFIKLAFRELKVVSSTEMQITYELTYFDQGRGRSSRAHPAKVTNKKLCQMISENGKWMIADVRNIKELVEFQDELALP